MNAMHTRWQNQAGEADKEALRAALSLGTRIFTRGRKGAGGQWGGPSTVSFAGRLLGELDGWQKGAQRQKPVQAREAV